MQITYDQLAERVYMIHSCQHIHFMQLPKLRLEAKKDFGEGPIVYDIDHGHESFHLLQSLSDPQELFNSFPVNLMYDEECPQSSYTQQLDQGLHTVVQTDEKSRSYNDCEDDESLDEESSLEFKTPTREIQSGPCLLPD